MAEVDMKNAALTERATFKLRFLIEFGTFYNLKRRGSFDHYDSYEHMIDMSNNTRARSAKAARVRFMASTQHFVIELKHK